MRASRRAGSVRGGAREERGERSDLLRPRRREPPVRSRNRRRRRQWAGVTPARRTLSHGRVRHVAGRPARFEQPPLDRYSVRKPRHGRVEGVYPGPRLACIRRGAQRHERDHDVCETGALPRPGLAGWRGALVRLQGAPDHVSSAKAAGSTAYLVIRQSRDRCRSR